MIRQPSTASSALAWYWQAINDKSLHLATEAINYDVPECGWYQGRQTRGGPFVPVRFWLEQEVCPDTGELLSDEIIKCEINGREADPQAVWSWVCQDPITEQEFDYMVARAKFARKWAPDEPAANPFKPTDWSKVPTPKFI